MTELKKNDYLETPDWLYEKITRFWYPVLDLPTLDLMASQDRGDGQTNSKCRDYIDEDKDFFKAEWKLRNGRKPKTLWLNGAQSINKLIMKEITIRFNQEQFNLISIFQARTFKTSYIVNSVLNNSVCYADFGNIFFYPIPKNIYFTLMGQPILDAKGNPEHTNDGWWVLIWFQDELRNRIRNHVRRNLHHHFNDIIVKKRT